MSLVLDGESYRTILESLPTGVYVVDRDRRIVLWNDGAERITGYLRQEVIGRCCRNDLLMHCDEQNRVLCGDGCPLLDTMRDGGPKEVEVYLRHKSGERVPVRVRTVALRDRNDCIVGAVESFEEPIDLDNPRAPGGAGVIDWTEAGGPDQMESMLSLALAKSDLASTRPAVMSLALDHIDHVRQKRGGMAAEALVRAAGHSLAHSLHPGDIAGRVGADRLVAILLDCPAESVRQVASRIRRLLGMVAVPWWGDRLTTTVSVGIAVARPGENAQQLFGRSAEALAASVLGGGDREEIV